jgi:hypothetical protein
MPVNRFDRKILIFALNPVWRKLFPVQGPDEIQDDLVAHRVAVIQPIVLIDDHSIEVAPIDCEFERIFWALAHNLSMLQLDKFVKFSDKNPTG